MKAYTRIIKNYIGYIPSTKTRNFQNIYVLLFMMATSSLIAQLNTNLGQNAGNSGFFNTSIGGVAGDKVTGNRNSFLGHWSGAKVTSGNDNTFLGFYTGFNLISGNGNVFIGSEAGRSVTSRSDLTFIGTKAGQSNTSGSSNTFLGYQAGLSNTIGWYNTFQGYNSGYSNTTGKQNTFTGTLAGESNTEGFQNTFVGSQSGKSNTMGNYNTFVGSRAGPSNTTGELNTFIGSHAGLSNTTGDFNTFMGTSAGQSNTTGIQNTVIGNFSGRNSTEGSQNTFLGYRAGNANIDGWANTYIGFQAGYTNKGHGNVFLGRDSGKDVVSAINKLYIQNGYINPEPIIYGDFETGNLALGNTDPNGYRLYVNGDVYTTGQWTSSDKRFKKDRTVINNALETLSQLEGVTYQFKQNQKSEHKDMKFPKGKQFGLIAQEVENILPELVRQHKDGYMAINYQGLIPVLIEAIKELNDTNTTLKEEVEQLKINQSNARTLEDDPSKPDQSNLKRVKLYQNTPNPFGTSTSIRYELPNEISSASIYIFDMQGTQKKVYKNLLGKQQITITSGELPSGMYMYSLIVNEKIIDTKKMLLTN